MLGGQYSNESRLNNEARLEHVVGGGLRRSTLGVATLKFIQGASRPGRGTGYSRTRYS